MSRFPFAAKPKTPVQNTVSVDGGRISVLTPYLIRVEQGELCDAPTQCVWNRGWETPKFVAEHKGDFWLIMTAGGTFYYSIPKKTVVKIVLDNGNVVTDFHRGNLKGTRRTLDFTFGATTLGEGLVSRSGVAVLEDGESLILGEDEVLPRPKCKDTYYFAYGNRYRMAIRDLYRLTGFPPLIPKFAFGNWWSRYKAYTQEEYRTLMQRFLDRKIPVTVATIDMDWHWVDVIGKFGKAAAPVPTRNSVDRIVYAKAMPGWTGYSWNTDLFPDYKALLKWLNDNRFVVTLNVHPSHGVRFFETQYEDVCRAVGKNPEVKKQIDFKLGDQTFLKAYFDLLHHPYEKEGVRFWWIDWQQGKYSDVAGLDPLWGLNHYHICDQAAQGKRPLILSRYAGIGSHRYPLGFSGDTMINWASLRFQPYFTATATNVGYTWWSHDIGGHHRGKKDDELYLRWLQFGVFSPINRLHSTSNEFMGKEPWKCDRMVQDAAERLLKFRHRLIPYLYSINYRTHTEGRALCEPMYYGYDTDKAYAMPNQYLFGSELIACPVTEKINRHSNLAKTKLWVPEGRYTDIFNGYQYTEGSYEIYRELSEIPVFAREGSILPLYRDDGTNEIGADRPLDVWIYRGEGEFTLYDDDGDTMAYLDGKRYLTRFRVRQDKRTLTFRMDGEGDFSVFGAPREIRLMFRDVDAATITVNGVPQAERGNEVGLFFDGTPVEITLTDCVYASNPDFREKAIEMISRFQAGNEYKRRKFMRVLNNPDAPIRAPKKYAGPLIELQAICKT